MTPKDILNRAAGRIEKRGLALGKAVDGTSVCTAAALVQVAYDFPNGKQKFYDNDYTVARNLLCGLLGISSSYEGIVQWNDDFYSDKKTGAPVYKRTQEEVVRVLRQAANTPIPEKSLHKTK